MSKYNVEEFEESELNEDLLKELADELENGINKVCGNNLEEDPRLELLIILGSFAAQVGLDSGYDKENFITLMTEMYDDFLEDLDPMESKYLN